MTSWVIIFLSLRLGTKSPSQTKKNCKFGHKLWPNDSQIWGFRGFTVWMKRGTFVGRSSRNCCSSACIAKTPARVCLEGERDFSFGESERERDARRRDGDKERERGVKVRSRCSPQQWGCWRERLQEEEEEKPVLWRYLTSGSRCSLLPKVCSISFKLMDLWLPKAAGNMLLRYYYYYYYYYY